MRFLSIVSICLITFAGFASGQESERTENTVNVTAITTFLLFILATLAITWFAAQRTKDQETFFAAGGDIPAWQNGLAIAGDFVSAATILGITGLMFFTGMDGYLLSVGVMVSWPLMMMIIAERFRNLGKFTFVDVITYRLRHSRVRVVVAVSSIFVVIFYLIGQMVGAGKLIELLFGFDYVYAIALVVFLMMCYVVFGGMIATTWVQMIKAILLVSGAAYIAILLLSEYNFDFSVLLEKSVEKHPRGDTFLEPGGWLRGDFMQVLTVGLTMCFGIMGLPHILMRFFTVKNAAAARTSLSVATFIMAISYVAILVIGLGAVAVVWGDPQFLDKNGNLLGGSNLVVLHLAKSVGGDILLGYMSAVAFATILAVVAGLTIAGSATIAHDLYGAFSENANPKNVFIVSRITAFAIGLIALGLGIAFENQNIAVVTSLALAIAASVNFPLLLLSMYWKDLTSRGCVLGGGITLLICCVMIIFSDGVWVQIFGNDQAVISLIYPTVVTMPICFLLTVFFSISDKTHEATLERERFAEQYFRSETGLGASAASQHSLIEEE